MAFPGDYCKTFGFCLFIGLCEDTNHGKRHKPHKKTQTTATEDYLLNISAEGCVSKTFIDKKRFYNISSTMIFGKPYFYTATIKDWHNAIRDNAFEEIIIQSLRFLNDKELIQIYGMVIMPNHIHLIWEMLAMNNKETPVASFMKFTLHKFLEKLRQKNKAELQPYEVEWISRKHNFWQKESLAIELFTEKIFLQKLNYIHNNPLQEKWKLVCVPEDYFYSSAKFYFTGGIQNDFAFLKNYYDRR